MKTMLSTYLNPAQPYLWKTSLSQSPGGGARCHAWMPMAVLHLHFGIHEQRIRMNTREALRQMKLLGANVINVPKTGEVRVSHPALGKPLILNKRKKHAVRALTVALKKVERWAQEAA